MPIFRAKTNIGEWFAGFEALTHGFVFSQTSWFNLTREPVGVPEHHHRAAKYRAGKLHNARGGAHQRFGAADQVVDPAMASTPGSFGLSKFSVGFDVAQKHGQPERFSIHRALPKWRSQIEISDGCSVFDQENPKNGGECENTQQ
jgi:hypothetical protein